MPANGCLMESFWSLLMHKTTITATLKWFNLPF